MDLHVYDIADRPGAHLCIGTPRGERRPAIWIVQSGSPPLVLGRFYGEKQATVVANFLDTMTDAINRVIKFYADQHGDDVA